MRDYVVFSDVSKYYQMGQMVIKAIDHINFSIAKGEFCIIVGPSGAGKTTVLNMLGGMDTCTEGTISVDGTVISGFSSKELTTYRRYDVGFVFQFYNLVQNLTALENVELASQICRDPLDAATAVREVGLEDRMDNFPSQLSGGEQQRISIARAMLKDAPIVIRDEATSYTDPENEAVIQSALAKLVRGKTLLVIAHRLSTIADADQIIVVNHGKIEATGTQSELLASCPLYQTMWEAHISVKDDGEVA